jgi:iron complex transport system substrate-binding protein
MYSAFIRQVGVFISACGLLAASNPAIAQQETTLPSGGVVSASLCADAYVLALAEPEFIRALSWQVDQPVSAAPGWARGWTQAWPDAERLLVLDAEVIVFGAGEGGRAASLLDRAGRRSIELSWTEDFAGVRANFRRIGAAIDRVDAAERAIENLDNRLAQLDFRAGQRGDRADLVYLSASGGSAGTNTYVDAAIRAAGARNVIADAGISGWTRSDPELVLTLEADLILTSFFRDGFSSTYNRALRHSAYDRLLDTTPSVDVPSGYWPCAGPMLIDAAEAIADALDGLEIRQ